MNKIHGHALKFNASPEYKSWSGIIQRCCNPKSPAYNRYGGRGIKVCPEWRDSFQKFLKHVGCRPTPTHSIDRIDNNGNYEPGNVRWATIKEQAQNKRTNQKVTYNGETLCVSEWSRRLGIGGKVIGNRLNKGWSAKDALTTPVKPPMFPRNKKYSQADRELDDDLESFSLDEYLP